ncbi:MAG: hypothetical protein MSA15_07825 [Clostridium sp.]|nr:hypothetical protein [Clostridium sp.]
MKKINLTIQDNTYSYVYHTFSELLSIDPQLNTLLFNLVIHIKPSENNNLVVKDLIPIINSTISKITLLNDDNVEVLNYEGTYMIGRVVRNNVEDLITLEINDISSIKQ